MIPRFAELMDLATNGQDVFAGPPSPDHGSRTFGGQFLAQSLGAAQRTVPDDRVVHSTHSYFVMGGDPTRPTELRVGRLREGRSFSQRDVVVLQDDIELFRSLVSFHVPEGGPDWQAPVSSDVGPPTNTQPYADYNGFTDSMLPADARPWSGRDRPIDVRYVNPPSVPLGQPVIGPQRFWLRVHGPLGADRALHDAALAYLTDTAVGTSLMLHHGCSWADEGVVQVSLDHAIWYHRPAKADEWLYYEVRVESTSGGRGLASGRFYDADGQLVATCMQEALMR